MLKKLICALLSGTLAFALCGVAAAPSFAADATDAQEVDYFEDGGTCNLAVGGTLNLDNGVPTVVSGSEHVSVAESGTVTGVSAGDAVLQWSSEWGDETATVHVYAGTVSTAKRTVYAAYNAYGDINASLTLSTPGADAHSTFAYEGDSRDGAITAPTRNSIARSTLSSSRSSAPAPMCSPSPWTASAIRSRFRWWA